MNSNLAPRPALTVVASLVLLGTWRFFGCSAGAGGWRLLSGFLLLGVIPALLVRFVFRQELGVCGVGFGDRFRTIRSFLVFAPVMVLLAYAGSKNPGLASFYPLSRGACGSGGAFLGHSALYVLYYAGWEFHFRGFLQHGLRPAIGAVPAVLLQSTFSAAAHIGDPAVEVLAAFAAGLLWGALAFRTRSLLSGLLQHALLGIALDAFLCTQKLTSS